MSCSNPIYALDLGVNPITGKHVIKIKPRTDSWEELKSLYGDSVVMLPCGKCDSCIEAHRKMWSLRCLLESSNYKENCFVTLTFDDDHYFEAIKHGKASLRKCVQKFIRSLRDKGVKVRYFGCCEQGSQSLRYHFHILLFGFRPDDCVTYGKKEDFMYFTSKFLSDTWNKGFVIVGDLSPETCAYVAGYCNKKSKDFNLQSFIFMSNKPGIGADYFEKNMDKIYKYDNIIFKNGRVSVPPRYCDKIADRNGVDLTNIKNVRLEKAFASYADTMRKKSISNLDILNHETEVFMKDKLTKRRTRKL